MIRFVEFTKDVFNSFLKALFPKNLSCLICKKELNEGVFSVCSECYKKLPFIEGKICAVCGRPLSNLSDYCLRCKNEQIFYKRAVSVFVYDDIIKKLIYRYKKNGEQYLSEFFAGCLIQKYAVLDFECDIAFYVPIHKNVLKRRGFNQSKVLCDIFCASYNLPVSNDNLVKVKDTGQQKALNKADRIKNLEKSFKVKFKEEVKGKNILLIDDIMTTGATANECAKVLESAGAKNVYVLTLATVVLDIAFEENVDNEALKLKSL